MRMGRNSIDRFRLWKVKPDGSAVDHHRREQLAIMLNQAARYFGLKEHERLPLPKAMTFAEAMKYFGEQIGIKAVAYKHNELMLPIIARDKKIYDAVLLLPYKNAYLVIGDKTEIISLSSCRQRFDEMAELRPFSRPYGDIEMLLHRLRSVVPLGMAGLLFLLVATFLIAYIGAVVILLTELGEKNRGILVFGAVGIVLAIVVLVRATDSLVGKNYRLCSSWLFDNVYRRYLQNSAEKIAVTSVHDMELMAAWVNQCLNRWFVMLPRLIASVIFVGLATAVLFCQSVALGVSFFLINSGLIVAIWFMQRSGFKKMRMSEMALADLFLALEFYRDSRSAVFGLGVSDRFSFSLSHAFVQASAQQHAERFRMMDALYFLVPCGLFVVAIYVLCFASSTELMPYQSAAILTLVVTLAVVVVFVGDKAGESIGLGFEQSRINTINSWPKESARVHVEPVHLAGAIELASVSFSYQGQPYPVFRDFSVKIDAKDYLLITGPSGAGKTTLLKILAGVDRPYLGEILFDGQDIRALNQTTLRNSFGVVFDHTDIFVGSIYHNIMCGRQIANDALTRLLLAHEVFDTLLDLPMALETYIIDRGKNISRLERSAILLARALVHQPKILFLDEIFCGLSLRDQTIVADFLTSLSITRIVTAPLAAGFIKSNKTIDLPNRR